MLTPHLFIIFGATGDLAQRKLLPGLLHMLHEHGAMDQSAVLGVARHQIGTGGFREQVSTTLAAHPELPADAVRRWVDERVFFHGLGEDEPDYGGLAGCIEHVEDRLGLPGNRAFYLSLPPAAFEPTLDGLYAQGLTTSPGWTRVVVEKPFGHDLASARALNELVHRFYDEEQIYRIDHFLGKETVQNLLTFRLGNPLFETNWNRDRIEHIEITAAETLGLEGRASYYARSGALRDMIQNHLTQIFTLVAMEPPASFGAAAIQREKVKVLESVRPIDPERDVVFGRYEAGQIDGQIVRGFADEDGVPHDNGTETYAALRLHVDNWRWSGVPFYLRSGKRMGETRTQIAVRFRRAPASIFQPHGEECGLEPNVLKMTLKPDEGFTLCFEVKQPGQPFRVTTQAFQFRYREAFHDLPEAYETLLADIIQGDRTLFVDGQEAEAAWRLYTPVLDADIPVHPYPAGSWGPETPFLERWQTGP